jgi:hypothetical protein
MVVRDIVHFRKVGKLSAHALRIGSEASLNMTPESAIKLRKLANAGKSGKFTTNTHRDVMTTLGVASGMSQLYEAKAPMWDKLKGEPQEGSLWFLLPHEVINSQVESASEWFDFAEDQPGLRKSHGQWCARMKVNPANFVAVGLWGDSAPYHTRDSLVLVLFNVLTGSHNRRYWMCGISKNSLCCCGCSGRCTLEVVWKIFAWSMAAMLSGTYPSRRHDGTMLKDMTIIAQLLIHATMWSQQPQTVCVLALNR